jgi:S-adenosylmethionine:tRNA ribosyltransferase-isomerase
MMSDILTSSYDYHLPSELIAKYPAEPKDSSKLLVYDRASGSITHSIFRDIFDFLPKDTNFVFNNTKVIKARIFGHKESGGKIELLLNRALDSNLFNVFIKGRVKVGAKLLFDMGLSATIFEVLIDGTKIVKFHLDSVELDFVNLNTILDKIGHTPLPPYIDRDDEKSDEILYQSLFAKKIGAVAAPTASLHFTKEILEKIDKNFTSNYITLHIGAGTFKGVDSESILEHNMHSEVFEIEKSTQDLIDSNKRILSVGTTVTRTIEFYFREKKLSGECNLFLHPQNRPLRVNNLLTNFHLPKSTLLMLVSSFIGREKALNLYKEAIENQYRFFSYGDAMLIL